jgi:hypothetical protein
MGKIGMMKNPRCLHYTFISTLVPSLIVQKLRSFEFCMLCFPMGLKSVMMGAGSELWALKISVAIFCGTLSFMIGWFSALPQTTSFSMFNLNKPCPVSPSTSTHAPIPLTTPNQHHSIVNTNIYTPSRMLATVIVKEEVLTQLEDRGKGYHMEKQREVHPKVLEEVFSMVHHPASPISSEILLFHDIQFDSYASQCREIYLTRTGSLANMPNKCLALSILNFSHADPIPHTIRRGLIAKLQDKFSQDYADSYALKEEAQLLPPFLAHLDELSNDLRKLVGNQDTIIVMVLNTGVLDLFVNFLCSCRSAGLLDSVLTQLVVFTVQSDLQPVLSSMGVKVFCSPHLGKIPANAAGAYGDHVFGLLMWLKNSAVFVASYAGYNVLFQVSSTLA